MNHGSDPHYLLPPKERGCDYYHERGGYTCIETDAAHNAVGACEPCILRAGYASVAEREKAVTK